MADGDEIHANLPRRYLNIYRDICAREFDPEDTAHENTRLVQKDARDLFGNPPINFIVDCNGLLSRLPDEPLLRQTINFSDLQQKIDQIARHHYGNEQGMDLAKRAVRREIETYRQGGNIPNTESMVKGYFSNIHEARFSQRVPLTPKHLNDLSITEVNNRLNAMKPFSEKEYEHLARSIARDPDIHRRLQRRRYKHEKGLYDKVY